MKDHAATSAYSAEARIRIRQLGYDSLHDFIFSIPRASLSRILSRFPMIKGFRAGGPQSEEQARRLARRLAGGDREESQDWHAFTQLWIAWCVAKLESPELGRRLIRGDSVVGGLDSESDNAVGFREELEKIAAVGNVTREQLEEAIIYSPFANDATLLLGVRAAPTRETVDHGKRIEDLRGRVADLELRLAEASSWPEQVRQGFLAALDPLHARIVDVEKALHTIRESVIVFRDMNLEVELPTLSRAVESTSNGLDSVRQTLMAVVEELRERAALTAAREGAPSSSDKPDVSLEPVSSSDGAIAQSNRIAFSREDSFSEADDQSRTAEEVREVMSESLFHSGLTRDAAAQVATEIVAGILTAQQITFRGSMADILLRATRNCVPGMWDVGVVPVGLGDSSSLRNWNRTAEANRGLVLIGANNSAYEIYGSVALEEVSHHQIGLRASSRIYLCTLTEGPGSLPLVTSFADLGPIIDSDSLQWRTAGGDRRSPAALRLDILALRESLAPIAAIGDRKGSLDHCLERLPVRLSALAVQSMTRAFAALLQFSADDELSPAWSSLFHAWIYPQLRGARVSQKVVKTFAASGEFAEAASSKRGSCAISALPDPRMIT